MSTIYFEKMFDDVKDPIRKNPTDSGIDVYGYRFLKLYQNFGKNTERILENEPEYKDGRINWDRKRLLDEFIAQDFGKLRLAYLERVLIGTGLKATVGKGYEIQIRPRSGLALNNGLVCNFGTIDHLYKGELGIILINLSRKEQMIELGTRIAQLVAAPVELSEIKIVDKLPKDGDRKGGFGSSGDK